MCLFALLAGHVHEDIKPATWILRERELVHDRALRISPFAGGRGTC